MPQKTVAASAANAMKGSFLWELAAAFNRFVNYRPNGPPNFEIRTNFDIQNGDALTYTNNGEVKTLATDQAFETGTEKVIAADRWGAARLSVDAEGAGVVTWAPDDYASEAEAIAALDDVEIAATETPLGYVTVLTGDGETWTAGTDALQGGTGGTPSADTNYYNDPLMDTLTTRSAGTP